MRSSRRTPSARNAAPSDRPARPVDRRSRFRADRYRPACRRARPRDCGRARRPRSYSCGEWHRSPRGRRQSLTQGQAFVRRFPSRYPCAFPAMRTPLFRRLWQSGRRHRNALHGLCALDVCEVLPPMMLVMQVAAPQRKDECRDDLQPRPHLYHPRRQPAAQRNAVRSPDPLPEAGSPTTWPRRSTPR